MGTESFFCKNSKDGWRVCGFPVLRNVEGGESCQWITQKICGAATAWLGSCEATWGEAFESTYPPGMHTSTQAFRPVLLVNVIASLSSESRWQHSQPCFRRPANTGWTSPTSPWSHPTTPYFPPDVATFMSRLPPLRLLDSFPHCQAVPVARPSPLRDGFVITTLLHSTLGNLRPAPTRAV